MNMDTHNLSPRKLARKAKATPLYNWQSYAKNYKLHSRHAALLHHMNSPDVPSAATYDEPTRDDLAVCLCYFSYCRYQKPLNNLNVVLEDMKRANIPHYLVELIYPGQDPMFPNSHVVHANTVMFHKENLWNIAERDVPSQYTKLIFLDGDIRFSRPDWYDATSAVLDSATIIQPFDYACWKRFRRISAACAIMHSEEPISLDCGHHHPGFSTAFDRNVFNKLKWCERALVGSGDSLFWHAASKASGGHGFSVGPFFVYDSILDGYSEEYSNLVCQYADDIKLGVLTDNTAIHLHHGSNKKRLYSDRFLR